MAETPPLAEIVVTECPDCRETGRYDRRVVVGGRGIYTCPNGHRWQDADETPDDRGYVVVNPPVVRPCGSCGEPGPYTITLDGEPMPACLRHLNVWRTPGPDYTCPSLCVEVNHPGREHGDWIERRTPSAGEDR